MLIQLGFVWFWLERVSYCGHLLNECMQLCWKSYNF